MLGSFTSAPSFYSFVAWFISIIEEAFCIYKYVRRSKGFHTHTQTEKMHLFISFFFILFGNRKMCIFAIAWTCRNIPSHFTSVWILSYHRDSYIIHIYGWREQSFSTATSTILVMDGNLWKMHFFFFIFILNWTHLEYIYILFCCFASSFFIRTSFYQFFSFIHVIYVFCTRWRF